MQAKQWQKVVIVSDLHAPFQSQSSFALLIEYLKREKPELVIFNGDMVDNGAISRFSRAGTEYWMDYKREIEATKPIIGELIDACKRVVWIEGNHEIRTPNFIALKAPELEGMVSIPAIYDLKKRRVEYIPAKRGASGIYELTHKLLVAHGERYSSVHSNNVARLTLQDAGRSIIVGHNHAEGTHRQGGGAYGKDLVCLVSSCLCESPSYRLFTKWTRGFIAGAINTHTAEFEVDHVRISDQETRLYSSTGTLLAVKTSRGYRVGTE